MKLDEATEILMLGQYIPPLNQISQWRQAIQLGIEALERLQYLRSQGYAETQIALPAETSSPPSTKGG